MAPERIEAARRLIDASVALIKSQEDYVLALNRTGMYLPAMLAFELLLIMRATLAFREARLQAMLRTTGFTAEQTHIRESETILRRVRANR